MTERIQPFKERLRIALEQREMRAVDLCNKTGISQSTISQYLSGYAEPKKKRLTLIANALDVNPTWLMGLNVNMEITTEEFLKYEYITKGEDYAKDIQRQLVESEAAFQKMYKKITTILTREQRDIIYKMVDQMAPDEEAATQEKLADNFPSEAEMFGSDTSTNRKCGS